MKIEKVVKQIGHDAHLQRPLNLPDKNSCLYSAVKSWMVTEQPIEDTYTLSPSELPIVRNAARGPDSSALS